MTRLWLDDLRPAPPGWTKVRSVNAAIRLLETGSVTHASLDYDLGDYAEDGGDGYHIVDWMAEHEVWPAEGVCCHSGNPTGRALIERMIARFGSY